MKTCPICHADYEAGEIFCPVDGARLVSPSATSAVPGVPVDPLINATLSDRYHILRRIGEGGMGIVYEAEHVLIEKRVALKVLRADFSSRMDLVARFRQEAKSASRIGHSHIVDISDFGETPSGESYFVMEMLDGEDLANLLEREGLVVPARAVHVVLQCCRALGAAHTKGIVHRDMKPENVFLCEQDGVRDFVKIVDFGIAMMNDLDTVGQPGRRLTKTGMIFGTPEYMSPEQAAGQPLDHRVDIYGLGIILYELVTGRVPFRGDNFLKVLSQHTHEPPPPLASANPHVQVSMALERVIFKALAKSPDARFHSMDAMAQALLEVPETGEVTLRDSTVLAFPPVTGDGGTAELPRPSVGTKLGKPRVGAPTNRRLIRHLSWVVAGIGALIVWRQFNPASTVTDEEAAVSPPAAAEAASLVASTPPQVAMELTVGDVGTEPDEGPELGESVVIQVRTRPSGASVSVLGGEGGCRPTPCELTLPKGERVTVVAKRGRLTASTPFAPEEARPLMLELRRPQRLGR